MIFSKKKKRTKDKDKEKDRAKLLGSFPSNSRYAESYRTLRTNLFFSDRDNEIKSILITSALEKEGKTNTSINLGYTIAQTDRKVLVVDGDLRRPYLSSLLTGREEWGVTELVSDVLGVHLTKGSLDTYCVSDLILLAGLQKRSVHLDLENNTTRASLLFEKGKMVDIHWKSRPESKNLVNILLKEKLLTEKQAQLVLNHQKKSVQGMGAALRAMGGVPRKDLSKVLSVYTVEAVRAVSAMKTGHFTFSLPEQKNREQEQTVIHPDIDLEKLYTEFKVDDSRLTYCKAAIDKAVLPTEIENLSILPAGEIPPNPSEIVCSGRMAFLIENLKTRYDFIIIDTPPVTMATDALLMTPLVDESVLVVKSANTDRKIIQDAIDQFKAVNHPIIGVVLNQVDMRKEGYYRYYQKYYTYYYGSR